MASHSYILLLHFYSKFFFKKSINLTYTTYIYFFFIQLASYLFIYTRWCHRVVLQEIISIHCIMGIWCCIDCPNWVHLLYTWCHRRKIHCSLFSIKVRVLKSLYCYYVWLVYLWIWSRISMLSTVGSCAKFHISHQTLGSARFHKQRGGVDCYPMAIRIRILVFLFFFKLPYCKSTTSNLHFLSFFGSYLHFENA